MKIFYFHETGKQRYRVWREDWLSDQFEIFTERGFSELKDEIAFCNARMGIGFLRFFNVPKIELVEQEQFDD